MSISYVAITDTGQKRQVNEDSLWPQTTRHDHETDTSKGMLFVIADGMGGHGAGDVASNLAITEIVDKYYGIGPEVVDISQRLEMAIRAAHQKIREIAAQSPETENMGTTVAAMVVKYNESELRGEAWLGWAGDSRIYLHRAGKLSQVSRDHSHLWSLIEAEQITWDEIKIHPDRSKITNALVAQQIETSVDKLYLSLEPGDLLLLCSDGLSGEIRPENIEQTLSLYPLEQAATSLIKQANAPKEIVTGGQTIPVDGGNDNISLILIEIPGDSTLTLPVQAATRTLTPAPELVSGPPASKSSRLSLIIIVGLLVLVGLIGSALFVLLTNSSGSDSPTNVVLLSPTAPTDGTDILPTAAQNAIIVVDAVDTQQPATDPPVAATDDQDLENTTAETRQPTSTRGATQSPTPPPTATSTSTSTPSPFPTPTATAEVTATTVLTSVTVISETAEITATAIVTVDIRALPIPILVTPDADANNTFSRDVKREIVFKWEWPGELPDFLGFEIMVWLKDEKPIGAHDAKQLKLYLAEHPPNNNQYTYPLSLEGASGVTTTSGDYLWTVAIVRLEPAYVPLDIMARPRPISLVVSD